MYVLKHRFSKQLLGVRFESDADGETYPVLVQYDENNISNLLFVQNEVNINYVFYTIRIEHPEEDELLNVWIGDYLCRVNDIKEYVVVSLKDHLNEQPN